MKLTGIRTKRKALDFALSVAERSARRNGLLAASLSAEELQGAADPSYDLLALREKVKPRGRR